jgi:hypothetical protein
LETLIQQTATLASFASFAKSTTAHTDSIVRGDSSLAQTLWQLVEHYEKFLYLPRNFDTGLLALWTLHTYLLEELEFSPRLIFNASQMNSGKTTALERLRELCFEATRVSSFSSEASIQNYFAHAPRTLMLDEAELTFNPRNPNYDALMSTLNDGYMAGAKRVTSTKNKEGNYSGETKNIYGAIAIAGTHTIYKQAFESRSIKIQMYRDTKKQALPFSQRFDKQQVLDIRQAIELQLETSREHIANYPITPKVFPKEFDSRRIDIFSGLVQIALTAGSGWYEWIIERMWEDHEEQKAQFTNGDPELTRVQALYRDIFEVFKTSPDFLSSTELVEKLRNYNPESWSLNSIFGKPLSTMTLANYLRPDGIHTIRPSSVRGYNRNQFRQIWESYSLTSDNLANLANLAE